MPPLRHIPYRLFALILLLGAIPAAAAQDGGGDRPADIPHPNGIQSEQLQTIVAKARSLFEEQLDSFEEDAARADAYGRLGMIYQALSFEDAARIAYENALALNPDDARWHHFVAFVYQERGERTRAAEHYRRVLELEPNYLPARVRLALLLYDADRPEEAELEFGTVLAADPDNTPALAGLGRIAMEADRYREAIERFEQALQLEPQASQVHYLLGLAYRQIGDTARARTHLDQAGDIIPRINDPWLVTMQVHSQTADYYLAQGLQAVQAGQIRDAFNVFQLAALVDPKEPRAYVSLARASQALGNIEATESFIRQALTLAPDNAATLFNAGLLRDQAGDTDEAISYYRQALEQTPGFSDALVYLANALMRKGQYDEAVDLYGRASVLHDNTEAVLHLQALALLALDECEQAMEALKQSLAIDPSQGDVIQTQARTFVTCPAATEEQRRTALVDARTLYDLRPNLTHAATLAMAEAAMGNFDDAIDFQTQAIFESLKAGGPDQFPGLTENMERYRRQQPALRPWPTEHPVYRPEPPAVPTVTQQPDPAATGDAD